MFGLFLDWGGDHSGWKRIEAFSKHPGVEIMGAVGGRTTGKPVEVAVVDYIYNNSWLNSSVIVNEVKPEIIDIICNLLNLIVISRKENM